MGLAEGMVVEITQGRWIGQAWVWRVICGQINYIPMME